MKKLFKWKMKKKVRGIAAPYWEWFNRTRFVADRIKELGHEEIRVLDVGGTKKENLLRKMGIRNIVAANICNDADIITSGHKLPFKDSSFECVTCIDTLEHIPQDIRGQLVQELIRVASRAVFIVAPVDTKENNRAEDIVLKHLSAGFIKEHRVFGLVDFEKIKLAVLEASRQGRVEIMKEADLDDLMYWVAMMLGDKVEVSELYQELYFLENKFHPRRKALSIYLK